MTSPRSRLGFTLIEMLVVVAIIGILAAVAIPALVKYIKRSKAAEAVQLMQIIREKEEAYYSNGRSYYTQPLLNVMPDHNSAPCQWGNTCLWAGRPNVALWQNVLRYVPDAPTYYDYWVNTNYNAFGVQQPNAAPADVATAWGNVTGWYVVYARGDIDRDGIFVRFSITSRNASTYRIRESTGLPDEATY